MDLLIETDYQRLSGTWLLSSGVVDGQPVPEDIRKKTRLVTTRDKFTVSTGTQTGTSEEGTFTIDPTKTPKTWDYTITEGPEKGLLTLGIYELKGDELTLCYVEGGDKARPTEFAVGGKGGEQLQVWKRQKR